MRVLLAVFAFLLAFGSSAATAQSDFPTLLANRDLFTEAEWNGLQRDADLAQRSGVPIMFAIVEGDGTSAGSAQQFADTYRAEHEVETEAGADDGIVLLVHWVPTDPARSTVVYSAGAHAFETTGLSDATIQKYIDDVVTPILQDGRLFDASAFLMRYTRQTSLYVPPPVAEITGFALGVKRLLAVAAPLSALALAVFTWKNQTPTERQRWNMVGITIAGSLLTAVLSEWTHSRIGIACILISLISLAIWCLWTTRDRERSIDWKAILPDVAITLLLISVSLGINWNQVETTPGDRDETRWINRAYYAADLKDPFGPTWQDYIITVGQPPLGSIAIGIGMAIQGEDLRATGVWDYQYDRNWYKATGGYPSDETREAGRRTNAVIGALTTGAAYVLGRLMTNRAGGIAAGVYLAWHPLHIVLSTQALSDETFALMLVLALISAWQFAKKPTWARAMALGMFLGLGGATKLTPLLLAPPLLGFGVLRLWLDRTPPGKRAGWMLIAQPFIAFATFVAIYPWTWPNPISRTWRLFDFRSGEMDAQTSAWPNALTNGPLDALSRFGHKLTYTHSTSQKALQHFYDWAGIERTAVGIDLVLAAGGAVILLWVIARRGLWTPEALVGALLFGELALLALGMKADFYRYHLPVIMIVAACVGVCVGSVWSYATNLIARRNTMTTTSLSAEAAIQ